MKKHTLVDEPIESVLEMNFFRSMPLQYRVWMGPMKSNLQLLPNQLLLHQNPDSLESFLKEWFPTSSTLQSIYQHLHECTRDFQSHRMSENTSKNGLSLNLLTWVFNSLRGDNACWKASIDPSTRSPVITTTFGFSWFTLKELRCKNYGMEGEVHTVGRCTSDLQCQLLDQRECLKVERLSFHPKNAVIYWESLPLFEWLDSRKKN